MKKQSEKFIAPEENTFKIEEPLVMYNKTQNPFDAMALILGGEKIYGFDIKSEFDLISLARKGLRKASVIAVAKYLGITLEKMSHLINTSMRTFQRKTEHEHLSVAASEQTIAVAEVIFKGLQVFGSKEKLNLWLNSSIPALNGCTPFSLLDTSFGINLVIKTLVRLEQGVYN